MESRFIITPRHAKAVMMTVRISAEANTNLEFISNKSGHSRNDLINRALEFAFANTGFLSSVREREEA